MLSNYINCKIRSTYEPGFKSKDDNKVDYYYFFFMVMALPSKVQVQDKYK